MHCGWLYYFHQVGLLARILNRFNGNRNRRNEVRHRDPNAPQQSNADRPPSPPLTYVQLLQRFLIGIVASLWPTWDHRNMYPAVQ